MKLTLTAKSPAGYQQNIEIEGEDLQVLLDEARRVEMELARRGYTPTHPRPAPPADRATRYRHPFVQS